MLYMTAATILVNFIMAMLLSNVGGEFKKSVRASIIAALLANAWAVGAVLVLIYPIDAFGGIGRYLFLLAPMAIMYWLILFADNFPFSHKILTKNQRIVISVIAAISMIGIAVFASNVMYGSKLEGNIYAPQVSLWFYVTYALYFAAYSLLFSQTFLQKIHSLPSERKQQAWFAYRGTLFSSFLAFLTNLLLPIVGISTLLWAGPASSFIYAFSFLYAMRRYRLFELRRFALRAVVYASTIAVGVGSYALLMSGFRHATEQFTGIVINNDIFYACMTAIAIFLYGPLRRIFDRATKNIFFKNDYEIQNVIDILGDVLLRAKLRRDIAVKVGHLFRSTLLTNKVEIILEDDDNQKAKDLQTFFANRKRSIVSLDTDENNDDTIRWMRSHNYEIVVAIRLQAKHLGWIALGAKRSGDAYQQKDITLLDIASDEIAIAMESSLQFELIEEFNRTLQDRISDATKKLRTTNSKLREIDASKDEFISMASHQLRTPLTSIKGYVSMLLDGDLGEIRPEQRKALEEAYDSSQRMVYLIGDFLNLSRIQTGRFELERTPISLPKLLAEEIDQLKQSAKARNVSLMYDEPASFPVLGIDETKIRQVMMNFIDNAIYYAKPAGGEVLILLESHRDAVSFSVKDNGIGVPAQARKHLFTKFYRADNAKKARPDGTGIGLYMAKRVVVAHGGTIIFESKENEGSEFGFRLPIE